MESTSVKKKSPVKRILKWTGITFLVLLVLVIALPFIFKDKLVSMVKEETNKQLNAKVDFGDFDLSLISSFPNFRFSISNVSVVGKGDFEGDTLLSLKELITDINLSSVIKGENYEIREVTLKSPRILAQVLSDGRANWDITKPSSDTTAAPSDTSSTSFKMSIRKFSIQNAYIVYDDKPGNMWSEIKAFDFDLNGDFTQDNFVLGIKSGIQSLSYKMDGISMASKLKVNIKADLEADMPKMKFTFKENEFALNDLILGLDGTFAMPDNDYDMDLRLSAKQTAFKSILSLIPGVYTKDFAQVQTAGEIALSAAVKGIYNDKTMPAFNAHLAITNARFKYPDLPKSVENIQLKVDVANPNGNPDATLIDVEKFHIEMAGNPVDVKMHIATPVSDPFIDGTINAKIVLEQVKEFIPLEKGDEMNGLIESNVTLKGKVSSITNEKYEEFNAAGDVTVTNMLYASASLPYKVNLQKMGLHFTPQRVELVAFDALMGKSDIHATGQIDNLITYLFKDSLLAGHFNYHSDYLDINELMGPESATADTAAAAPADTAAMTVVEVPANIDFELNSSIKKLHYDKLEIDNLEGKVIIRHSRVDMSALKMQMLDGSMVISGFYDTKNVRKPEIYFDLNVNDFDIQKTFNAFNSMQTIAPIGKYAKGKFTATLNKLTGHLNEKMEPDYPTLTGGGVFKTKTVTVEGFEPFNKVADALKNEKYRKMVFNDINLTYAFKDGRVNVDPFKTKIQDAQVEIGGSTGFDQSLDYNWDIELPTKNLGAAATGALSSLLSQVNNAGIPASMGDKVKVKAKILGTVTKPEVKLGMGEALASAKDDLKNQATQLIEQKKTEVINDAKQKAAAEAEKIMADARKTAETIKTEAARAAEQVRSEGHKAADNLESAAKGPIEKMAAKKGAEKLRKEADEKARKINEEANAKANRVLAEAQAKADKLK